MRSLSALLVLIVLGGMADVRAQFGPGDEERTTGNEQKAWQAWLKALGTGPVYRVEVLFRHEEDGRLYYLRTLVSAKQPTGRMFGLGVNEKGKPIPAPNPGYVRELQELSSDGLAPLAETTRWYGVSLDRAYVTRLGELSIRQSDTASGMDLPTKPSAGAVGFHHGIFVVELLAAEQLAKEEPLRQDVPHFRQRTKELSQMLLTTHRASLLKHDHALANGIDITRDSKLLDEAHRRLQPWIDSPLKGNGFPSGLTRAVLSNGDERDVALSTRLLQKHSHLALSFLGDTLYLAKRTGGARVMPLWTPIVNDNKAGDEYNFVRLVRKLTPTVPAPTRGDVAVIIMVRRFDLRAADFHLTMAQDVLLANAAQAKLTPSEKENCLLVREIPSTAQYYFATEADRKRGREAALKWMAGYRPAELKKQ